MSKGQIQIYTTEDNQTQVEVKFDEDTVWLSQSQIGELFGRDRTVISRHLQNIFKEKELNEKVVSAYFAHTTQHGAIKGKTQEREIKYYNFDAIISVGYRVNSKRGTQFRQWATQRLKDYLAEGVAINQERLDQLKQTIQLIHKSGNTKDLQLKEAKGLLDIITHYTNSFVLLNQYDSHAISDKNLTQDISY